MCLAVPVRVVEVYPDGNATVEVGGVRNRISLALIDGAAAGDYVIVHAGFAINRLDVAEAEKALALFAEIARTLAQCHPERSEGSPAARDPSSLRSSG